MCIRDREKRASDTAKLYVTGRDTPYQEYTCLLYTSLIFCDLSTPKGDETFNVYDDVRNKLTEKGIPKEEIAFIHEYKTEAKKAELFAKVRAGQVRILMGSCLLYTSIGRTVHKISLEEARKEVEISNERNYNNFNTLMRENKGATASSVLQWPSPSVSPH